MKRSKVKQAQYNRQHRIYKYKVIRQFHEERGWSIKDMCSILKISRASYYKWLNKKPMEDKNSLLIKQIQEICEKNNRLFGYRKMTMKINKISKKPVNHKRIYRLMSLLDLQSVYRPRKRYPKNANKQQTAENVLKRQFETSKPNEVWVTDTTEIHIPGLPKLYLSSIVDLYDRSIVSYKLSLRNDSRLVDETLKLALKNNPGHVGMLHSDRGFQYTRPVFQKRLEYLGIQQSMSRVGHCIDNGPMESIQGILKDMLKILYPNIETVAQVRKSVKETINYYMNEYPQERFHGLTASEVREAAKATDEPVLYPIKENKRIKKYWEGIDKKKASLIASAIKEADLQ